MLDKVLSLLGLGSAFWNARADFRRKHVRYPGMRAEVVVGNRSYSVKDWSLGGISFETAPDARLTAGDKVKVVLRFRFPQDTITIEQQAHIVRAAKQSIAAKFPPLMTDSRRQFERILDYLHTQGFVESQVA